MDNIIENQYIPDLERTNVFIKAADTNVCLDGACTAEPRTGLPIARCSTLPYMPM